MNAVRVGIMQAIALIAEIKETRVARYCQPTSVGNMDHVVVK